MILITAVSSIQGKQQPGTSVIGFRTLVVQWNENREATEFAIKCINRTSGETFIRYTKQTQITYYNLNQDDTYEFQVAAYGNDGTVSTWSEKSFPVKPIMQLGWYINLIYIFDFIHINCCNHLYIDCMLFLNIYHIDSANIPYRFC